MCPVARSSNEAIGYLAFYPPRPYLCPYIYYTRTLVGSAQCPPTICAKPKN